MWLLEIYCSDGLSSIGLVVGVWSLGSFKPKWFCDSMIWKLKKFKYLYLTYYYFAISVPMTIFTSRSMNCHARTIVVVIFLGQSIHKSHFTVTSEPLSRSEQTLFFSLLTAIYVWFWRDFVRLSKPSATKTHVWRWISSYCIHLFLIVLESPANLRVFRIQKVSTFPSALYLLYGGYSPLTLSVEWRNTVYIQKQRIHIVEMALISTAVSSRKLVFIFSVTGIEVSNCLPWITGFLKINT